MHKVAFRIAAFIFLPFTESVHAQTQQAIEAVNFSQVQIKDPTFVRRPEWGPTPPAWRFGGVAEVHVYPGIAFITRGTI